MTTLWLLVSLTGLFLPGEAHHDAPPAAPRLPAGQKTWISFVDINLVSGRVRERIGASFDLAQRMVVDRDRPIKSLHTEEVLPHTSVNLPATLRTDKRRIA